MKKTNYLVIIAIVFITIVSVVFSYSYLTNVISLIGFGDVILINVTSAIILSVIYNLFKKILEIL